MKNNAIDEMVWQDPFAGVRGHHLITKGIAKAIPNLTQRGDEPLTAHVKLFTPFSDWTWYVSEFDPVTGNAFGLVDGAESELGLFNVYELAIMARGPVPMVERDRYFDKVLVEELQSKAAA